MPLVLELRWLAQEGGVLADAIEAEPLVQLPGPVIRVGVEEDHMAAVFGL